MEIEGKRCLQDQILQKGRHFAGFIFINTNGGTNKKNHMAYFLLLMSFSPFKLKYKSIGYFKETAQLWLVSQ